MALKNVSPSEKGPKSPGPNPSDENLLEDFVGGDYRAFETLFERYRDRIFGYLFRLVRERTLAEDLFQEVFLRLFRRADQFDSSRTFRSWFFRLAHNRAIDFLRSNREKSHREEIHEDFPGFGPSPEEGILQAERNQELDRMLQKLSGEHRAVLLLRFREDFSYQEIAEVQGCPVGTAKSRVHHAIRHLREMTEEKR